jgi:hypothetical protein
MCLWVSYQKFFFCILKSHRRNESDSLFRGTDPGIRIRIRTKMPRIPNTGNNSEGRSLYHFEQNIVFKRTRSFFKDSLRIFIPYFKLDNVKQKKKNIRTKDFCMN